MNIEEGFVGQAIEQCGRHLGYFHIGESHRGYLGTGTVDFTAVFRSLARIGYDGPIAFESFSSAVVDPQLSNMLGVWRNIWSDSHDLARHAKAFMEAQRLSAAHAVVAGGN
jgi:D-psicose/D-tagatose/L-ribulose 3-epimerase